jgi:hypothetical protein
MQIFERGITAGLSFVVIIYVKAINGLQVKGMQSRALGRTKSLDIGHILSSMISDDTILVITMLVEVPSGLSAVEKFLCDLPPTIFTCCNIAVAHVLTVTRFSRALSLKLRGVSGVGRTIL